MAKSKKALKPVVQQFNITKLPNDRSLRSLQAWQRAIAAAEDIHIPLKKPLYDLYKNIVLDAHVTAVMDNQRLLATTNIPWTCVDKNGDEVAEICEVIDTTFFGDILTYISQTPFYGHTLLQVDWNARTAELIPRENVNALHGLVLPNALNPLQGVPYRQPPYDTLTIEVGKHEDLGLLLKCAPWVLIKMGDISDWATFAEIFGMPLRVGYYDPSNPGNMNQVYNALKEMGGAGFLALPQDSKVEFHNGNNGQGNSIYEALARFCDQQISKAIVAQTMTTENGSSKSQAEVHLEIQDRVFAADRILVTRVLNEQLIPLLLAQGVSLPEGARFQAIDEEEELTAQQRLEMDLRIHREVGKLPKAYFAEEYNVEFVDDSDEIEESNEPNEPTEDPQPKKEKEKQKTTKKESLSLDDIPLHEQPLYIRLFDYIKGFFATAPK